MNVDVSRKVCAVIGSFDSHISYVKVMKAVNYLKDSEVDFFITNEDLTFPGTGFCKNIITGALKFCSK